MNTATKSTEWRLDPGRLAEAVQRLTGRADAEIATVEARPAAHRVDNMTTAALTHVSGTLVDGTPWRLFVKTLRPAWRAPLWDQIPPTFHDSVRRELNWEDEPRIYTGPLSDDLPGDLRLPELYAIDRDDELISLWLEDVADTTPWDVDRYRRTAHHLGRLAGRWTEDRAAEQLGVRRRTMKELFHGKISHADIPALADDALWETPGVLAATAAHGDVRGDLRRLAAVAPDLVEAYEGLPHALAHGDATPDNFRESGSGDIIAIDVSYVSPAPLGSDLSQLLVGRIESGAATADEFQSVTTTILPAYLDGLAQEGTHANPDAVEAGWAIALAVRSVFSELILDHRPDMDQAGRRELLARRALACRFGLDLALRVARRIV